MISNLPINVCHSGRIQIFGNINLVMKFLISSLVSLSAVCKLLLRFRIFNSMVPYTRVRKLIGSIQRLFLVWNNIVATSIYSTFIIYPGGLDLSGFLPTIAIFCSNFVVFVFTALWNRLNKIILFIHLY